MVFGQKLCFFGVSACQHRKAKILSFRVLTMILRKLICPKSAKRFSLDGALFFSC